jgi:hypothetical protein
MKKKDIPYHDILYHDLKCATRADDRSKLLSINARVLLADFVEKLQAKKSKIICVNQEYISGVTGKKTTQNKSLLKQLKDFFNYEYHSKYMDEGKRRNYVYVVEFTEDGELRATRPDLFYIMDTETNLKKMGKDLGVIPTPNRKETF